MSGVCQNWHTPFFFGGAEGGIVMNEMIKQLRSSNPVVLTVANMVTPADVANAVNAIGASPIMSCAPEEASEMTKIASAVTINVGTLTEFQKQEIVAVVKAAESFHKPIVLDPVAVAMPYRHQFVQSLLAHHHVTVIRGNAGEIASLAGVDWQSHGIDTGAGDAQSLERVATACAQKYGCVVALTGKEDLISDGHQTVANHLGTRLFQTYVGCGDMVSSIVAAFVAIGDDPLESTAEAVKAFTAAGQLAEQQLAHKVPGSFFTALLDHLYQLTDSQLASLTSENN